MIDLSNPILIPTSTIIRMMYHGDEMIIIYFNDKIDRAVIAHPFKILLLPAGDNITVICLN